MYANKPNTTQEKPRTPQITLRALTALALASGIGTASLRALSAPADKAQSPGGAAKSAASTKPLTEDDKIVHVLNRLGFGPRPGDVQKVKAIGLQAYINQQLAPDTINDSVVDQQLVSYTMLNLSDEQLMEMYRARQLAQVNARKVRKEIVSANTAKEAAANPAGANGATTQPGAAMTPPAAGDANAAPGMAPETDAAKARKKIMAAADPQERQEAMEARRMLAQAALPLSEAQQQFIDAKALRAIESERQLQEVLVDFWSNHFNIDVRKQACGVLKIADDRETIRPHVLGKFRDLLGASAHSPAMLVYLDNALSTSDTPPDMNAMRGAMNGLNGVGGQGNGMGRAALRRRMALMGNANVNGQAALGQTPAAVPPMPAKKKRGGLNENYGREIMELHTLGVDGGYTQTDVTEVARCFTGWGVGRPNAGMAAGAAGAANMPGMANPMPRRRQMLATGKKAAVGEFEFHPFLHDNGPKTVLGHQIPAGGGIRDGEMVLDILASHPSTMRHISTQLCQRLVSDNPPASLVDKCVQTWQRTDGDLREITRTIITSPEFYSTTAFRSKIKSPFEYAVSSVRALGGTYQDAATQATRTRGMIGVKPPKGGGYLNMNTTSLIGQIGTMGEPLFQYQAPTGYPEESQKWVSSGALISRMNFALALTGGKLGDVSLPAASPALTGATTPNAFIDRFAEQVLHGSIAPATRATLLRQISDTPDAPPAAQNTAMSAPVNAAATQRMAALLLGSPEFQRR